MGIGVEVVVAVGSGVDVLVGAEVAVGGTSVGLDVAGTWVAGMVAMAATAVGAGVLVGCDALQALASKVRLTSIVSKTIFFKACNLSFKNFTLGEYSIGKNGVKIVRAGQEELTRISFCATIQKMTIKGE